MARKLTVALCCFAVVGISAWAFAQEGGILQRARDAAPVIQDRILAEINQTKPSGQFQVIPVGEGAILLNVNTGDTWKLANVAGSGDEWVPLKRRELAEAESHDAVEAHTDSAEAHGHEPLTETPQSR